MLLFRLLIAVVLIALFLPLGHDPATQRDGEEFSAFSALAAAGAAVGDLGNFCDRQPQACAVGSRAMQAVGEHARAGAQALQGAIVGQSHVQADAALEPASEPATQPKPQSIADMLGRLASANVAAPPKTAPQDTLSAGDRQTPWRTPDIKPGKS